MADEAAKLMDDGDDSNLYEAVFQCEKDMEEDRVLCEALCQWERDEEEAELSKERPLEEMIQDLPPLMRKRKTTGSYKYRFRVSKEGEMPTIPFNWSGSKIGMEMPSKPNVELDEMERMCVTPGRRLVKPRRRMGAMGAKGRPGSGPGGSKGTIFHDHNNPDLVAPRDDNLTETENELRKTTEMTKWMEWRQGSGTGRSIGLGGRGKTPKDGKGSTNSKKCPKGNSRNLRRGGGPKSEREKDGKGSQKKINQFFMKKGESHGSSTNLYIQTEGN